MRELEGLRLISSEVRRRGGAVVGISTSDWDQIQFREDRLREGLVLLSDPDGVVIEDYGLSDATLGEEVARPATFVVGPDGVVQWRHLPQDWRRRLSAVDYLRIFDAIDQGVPVPPLDETVHP